VTVRSFLEELRGYLARPSEIRDSIEYRSFFLGAVEHLEKQGTTFDELSAIRKKMAPRLESYVYLLERRLLSEGLPNQKIMMLVESAIACELGLPIPYILSDTRRLILDDARRGLLKDLDPAEQLHTVPRYASEIRAIRESSSSSELETTAIGDIALELSGRDVIRWLLNVEVALSTGPDDPWRVDRDTLWLLGTEERLSPGRHLNASWASMDRLMGLGLVADFGFGGVTYITAHPRVRPMLRAIGEGSDTAMAVLVSALLDDDLHSRLPETSTPSASEALTRQTRLVVHEIRNALIPVQEALRSVDRAAVSAGFESSIEPYRMRIDSSVGRLLRFADELQDVASLMGESQDVFDLVSATRDAIEAIAAELGETPELGCAEAALPVVGVRSRFILAILNLLRNAYKATPSEAPSVAVSVVTQEDRVRIAVDDNGPGIPQKQRERVFVDGYSTNPGGSGHGLALARATIEDDMGGTLSCENGSELGGARFIATLTLHNGSAR
jgi:signal transduction histidine kinase